MDQSQSFTIASCEGTVVRLGVLSSRVVQEILDDRLEQAEARNGR